MIDNSVVAFLAYDLDGRLVYCNRTALGICRADDRDALEAAGFPRVRIGGKAPSVPLSLYLSRGSFVTELVLEVSPDKMLPCLVTGNILEDENNRTVLHYANVLDVTETHAYKARLEERNLELAAVNRAKSEFMANMSHELRTPLNAILGFSEIMRQEAFGPHSSPQYAEYAADIHDSGRYLLSLINDILDLSKIESGKYSIEDDEVDFKDVIMSSLRIVEVRASKADIRLTCRIEDRLPKVVADERAAKQILLNLLSNAIKFTPDGGAISVACRIDGEGCLELAVEDNGIGIAEDDVHRVLRPFAQVASAYTRNHEGTGLGLTLVDSLVELHGGRLTIESALGVGTTVRVVFPKERVGERRKTSLAPDFPAV